MKMYVEADISALVLLFEQCRENEIDVKITIVHSKKYGEYAVVETYRASLEFLRICDEVGVKDKRKE